jgi:flagellar biosynthesis protein FlhB
VTRSSSAEPTEAPTARRLLEARRYGVLGVSRDLSDALGFLAFVSVAAVGAGPALTRLGALFRAVFSARLADAAAVTVRLAAPALDVMAALIYLPVAATLAAAVVATALQTRGALVWRSPAPDPARLSPASILARLARPETLSAIVRTTVKLALLATVMGFTLAWPFLELARLTGAGPRLLIATIGMGAKMLGISAGASLITWGALDWWLVRRRHQRALMMTRAEAMRERRETEGDPLYKAARRRRHRDTIERRLAESVRRADFVVRTGGGGDLHALAIGYERTGFRAPIVLAKGERLLAASLIEIARAAGIPVHLEDDLTRALGDVLEGDEIPEASYQPVAELLRGSWRAR